MNWKNEVQWLRALHSLHCTSFILVGDDGDDDDDGDADGDDCVHPHPMHIGWLEVKHLYSLATFQIQKYSEIFVLLLWPNLLKITYSDGFKGPRARFPCCPFLGKVILMVMALAVLGSTALHFNNPCYTQNRNTGCLPPQMTLRPWVSFCWSCITNTQRSWNQSGRSDSHLVLLWTRAED